MPNYFAYKGNELDSVRLVKALGAKGFIPMELKEKWINFDYRELEKVYDSHVITAEYLINNIENAFDVWTKKPWNKHYTFDDFCELILPYRIGNEPLEEWRSLYRERFECVLDSLYEGTDVVEAVYHLSNKLKEQKFVYNVDFKLPRLGPLFLLKNHVGGCRETCDYTVYILRSIGIPVTVDIYHYSPENQHDHLWNVVKDTTNLYVPFEFMEGKISRKKGDGRRKGKVYRMCFSPQNLKYIEDKYNEIPYHLRDPFLKDATASYFGENEFVINAEIKNECFVFIGVFTPRGWLPVDVARNEKGKMIINNIEPDVIFQPLLKDLDGIKSCGFPFVYKNDKINYLIPDLSNLNKVELYRKYPLRDYIWWYMTRVVGGKIEASNTLEFNDKILLCQIDTPKVNYNTICFNKNNNKFKYIRYVAPKDKLVEFAELKIFDSDMKEVRLSVVAGSSPYKGDEHVRMDRVVDGDYLTYCLSEELGGFVTFRLERPSDIGKLLYIPRNDENFISIGDTYELFYQAGAEGWLSLGKRTATEPKVIYDNIPNNSLLWLRNLSRGREEQIFWIENGRQMFLEYQKISL